MSTQGKTVTGNDAGPLFAAAAVPAKKAPDRDPAKGSDGLKKTRKVRTHATDPDVPAQEYANFYPTKGERYRFSLYYIRPLRADGTRVTLVRIVGRVCHVEGGRAALLAAVPTVDLEYCATGTFYPRPHDRIHVSQFANVLDLINCPLVRRDIDLTAALIKLSALVHRSDGFRAKGIVPTREGNGGVRPGELTRLDRERARLLTDGPAPPRDGPTPPVTTRVVDQAKGETPGVVHETDLKRKVRERIEADRRSVAEFSRVQEEVTRLRSQLQSAEADLANWKGLHAAAAKEATAARGALASLQNRVLDAAALDTDRERLAALDIIAEALAKDVK